MLDLKIWSFQYVLEVFNVTEFKIRGEPSLMGLNAYFALLPDSKKYFKKQEVNKRASWKS